MITQTDKEILKILQEEFPIEEKPFEKIAQNVGLTESELIERIKKLKEEKIIRQISPIYDTKALGYDSSLVAFKTGDNIEKIADEINKHPGVSHNYERTDSFNLWFTIAVPPDSSLGLEETVHLIAEKNQITDYVILRTVKMYKIGVKLDFDNSFKKEKTQKKVKTAEKIIITDEDKKIIKTTQFDIPLIERPFLHYSSNLNIPEGKLIQKLNQFKEIGIMRRFAAILYHRRVGYKANGMIVWNVPEEKADHFGEFLASYKSVTHCYKRQTNEKWKYNIFSMVHGRTKDDVESFAQMVSKETGIRDYKILYSTREFKKQRIRYFSDDFYIWEEDAKNGKYSKSGV